LAILKNEYIFILFFSNLNVWNLYLFCSDWIKQCHAVSYHNLLLGNLTNINSVFYIYNKNKKYLNRNNNMQWQANYLSQIELIYFNYHHFNDSIGNVKVLKIYVLSRTYLVLVIFILKFKIISLKIIGIF